MGANVIVQEAIEAVRAHLGERAAGTEFHAEYYDNYLSAWYVTIEKSGRPLIGGTAFVVIDDGGRVFEVSASKPPFLNIRELREWLDERTTENSGDS